MIGLKGQFPFRVGAPSYVIPADIMSNVRHLADCVDDIEIVLFESDAISNLPDEHTFRELKAYAREKSLTYTVHLPLDADIGSRNENERRDSVQKYLRVISRTALLNPHSYIVHLPAPSDATDMAERAKWHASLSRSANELLASGLDCSLVAVETLDYPFEWVEKIVENCSFSICLDIGHALLHGYAIQPLIERQFGRTRVVHVHGVDNGQDHCCISRVDPDVFSLLFSTLHLDRRMTRVLTIEVFNEERLRDSLKVLAAWVEK